jgi:hypothetical protein
MNIGRTTVTNLIKEHTGIQLANDDVDSVSVTYIIDNAELLDCEYISDKLFADKVLEIANVILERKSFQLIVKNTNDLLPFHIFEPQLNMN